MTSPTSLRKADHLRLCAESDVSFGSPGFEDIRLVHNAAGGCDFDDLDTRIRLFGKELSAPLFIAAMTGGHPDTRALNRVLAETAESENIAIGVGSQRAALEDPAVADSYTVVRDAAPDAFVAGNIGAAQLAVHGPEWAVKAVDLIDADALCIHLNPLQELFQPEGDRIGRGILEAVHDAASAVRVPVIVKETGAGMSREAASAFFAAGASAVDVGGFGGTSWAKVELMRSDDAGDKTRGASTESLYLDWGIPTAVSVFEVSQVKCGPVIATGGLKSGLDVAKSIVLGADMGGMAKAFLLPAMKGTEALKKKVASVVDELKYAMFLTGAETIGELAHVRYYMTGTVARMTAENKGKQPW